MYHNLFKWPFVKESLPSDLRGRWNTLGRQGSLKKLTCTRTYIVQIHLKCIFRLKIQNFTSYTKIPYIPLYTHYLHFFALLTAFISLCIRKLFIIICTEIINLFLYKVHLQHTNTILNQCTLAVTIYKLMLIFKCTYVCVIYAIRN